MADKQARDAQSTDQAQKQYAQPVDAYTEPEQTGTRYASPYDDELSFTEVEPVTRNAIDNSHVDTVDEQ